MQKRQLLVIQTVNLLDTMIEGAHYIQNQLNDGDLMMAIRVSEDLISAFFSVKETLNVINTLDVELFNVEEISSNIQFDLEKIVSSYETGNHNQVVSIIKNSLIEKLESLKELLIVKHES